MIAQESSYYSLIDSMASKYSLEPVLIRAFVMVESGGVSKRCRYEPEWKHFYMTLSHAKALGLSEETERRQQMFSYGLMQVMGAVARELGFMGYLNELGEIPVGLEFGCKKLSRCFDKYKYEHEAISAYNCGSPKRNVYGQLSNQEYVDRIVSTREFLRRS